MEIEKIVLKNYRQYKDDTIKFSTGDPNKRFTVIQGANGAGKTNIVNSITWCLYGEELHLGDKYRGLPIINNITLENMSKHETDEVKVDIHIKDEDNKKIIFSRFFTFKKLEKGQFETLTQHDTDSKSGTTFKIWKQINKDLKIIEDPEEMVKKIFPKSIQEYFFFDGERLDDYFKKPSYDKVKEEVFKISQIDLLENVFSHLSRTERSYSAQTKGLNPKLDIINTQIYEIEEEMKKKSARFEELKDNRKKAEIEEHELSKKLKDIPSSKEIKNLQEKRERLDEEYKKNERELYEIEQEQIDYLSNNMPFLFCFKAIKGTYDIIGEKIEGGEIPPKIKKEFLEKLLARGRCICDRDISKDSEAQTRLKLLLKECKDLDEISQELFDEKFRLANIMEKLNEFQKEQKKYSKDIRDKKDKLDQISKELKRIHNQLKEHDEEMIRTLENQYDIVREELTGISEEIGRIKEEIDRLDRTLTQQKETRKFELRRIEKKNKLQKTVLFCQEALEATEKIKNEITEEMRTEIQKRTKDQFFELIWKKESFKNVIIDEIYRFSVLDRANRETIGTLSAGERECLALSFLAALNIVSGFNSPIIMDTPLARISKEPRINIVKKLPDYLKGKQVIFLLTEEEYTEEIRNKIKKSIGIEYKISFKESPPGCESKVVPYEK